MSTQETQSKTDGPAETLALAPGSPLWPCPNHCENWVRCEAIDLRKPMPNHHSQCEHYNSSLIDVWRVTVPGEKGGCICGSEEEAREMAGDDPDAPMDITKERMHREVFENLPEFCGF